MEPNLGLYFLSEFVGTATLVLMGNGVMANSHLSKTKGHGLGMLMIAWGWGLAVFCGVMVAAYSGGMLNPAVSIALFSLGSITLPQLLVALPAQFLGAIFGAVWVWLAYRTHFDATEVPGEQLAAFTTRPQIRSWWWNGVTEFIGTFVLMFVILAFNDRGDAGIGVPGGIAPLTVLPVALVVVGLVVSLGGPTGTALNPARDLGPRIAHALLPMKGKGSSEWWYAAVPVVAPILGAVTAAAASGVLLHLAKLA